MSPVDATAALVLGGMAVNAMEEEILHAWIARVAAGFRTRPHADADQPANATTDPTADPGAPGPDASSQEIFRRLREMQATQAPPTRSSG